MYLIFYTFIYLKNKLLCEIINFDECQYNLAYHKSCSTKGKTSCQLHYNIIFVDSASLWHPWLNSHSFQGKNILVIQLQYTNQT